MYKFNVFVSFIIILLITALSIIIGAIFFNEKSFLDNKINIDKILSSTKYNVINKNNDSMDKNIIKTNACKDKYEVNECKKTTKTDSDNQNLVNNNNKDIVVVLIENNVIDKTGKTKVVSAKKGATTKNVVIKNNTNNKKNVKTTKKKQTTNKKKVVKKKTPVSTKRIEKDIKKVDNRPVKRSYTDVETKNESNKYPVKRKTEFKEVKQQIKEEEKKKTPTAYQRKIQEEKVIKEKDNNKTNQENKQDKNIIKSVSNHTPTKRNEKDEPLKYPTKRQREAIKQEIKKDDVIIKNVEKPERKVENARQKEVIEIEKIKEPTEDEPQEIHNIIKIEIDEDDNVDDTKTIDDSDIIEEETQIIKKASKQ